MHTDLVERFIARRLRALADDSNDTPYEWAEFQRRRRARSTAMALIRRNRPAVAAVAAAAVLVAGFAIANLSHHRTSAVPAATTARVNVSGGAVNDGAESVATPDRPAQEQTHALEGWLANLPRNPAVVRVGAHAAVTSLQDQIAALDDLMSAERVSGAQPSRLGALERQRAQLVSSLVQVQYAEMLASANP
ncbi:MAG: hypothetical protein ACRES6_06045 [Steroidobacteraceae bacterium]